MSRKDLLLLPLLLWAAVATAAPPARVLVADPDPELVRAIDTSLAPWRITVIAEADVPDEAHAHARADAVNAQFIVWRDRDQLIVYDRERGTSQRRTTRAGAFDAVSAAAAALTVKTMLRLPPVAETPGENGGIVGGAPVPVTSSRRELRLQIGVGALLARGSQTDLAGRGLLAVLVRPTPDLGLRLGLAADLNTSSDVSKSGFKGTWSAWSVLGVASWGWSIGPLEVGPSVGVGVSRSHLEGDINMTPRSESATLPLIRGGAFVRWPLGAWSIGAWLDADFALGTPTYTKDVGLGATTIVFEVPTFATVVGVFAAADLGH